MAIHGGAPHNAQTPRISCASLGSRRRSKSFWHVLLWTAFRSCEHTMPPDDIVSNFCRLFDYMYFGTTGQAKGGQAKHDLLMAGKLVKLELGSIPLRRIFLDASRVLASRYPRNRKLETDFKKVQDIWEAV